MLSVVVLPPFLISRVWNKRKTSTQKRSCPFCGPFKGNSGNGVRLQWQPSPHQRQARQQFQPLQSCCPSTRLCLCRGPPSVHPLQRGHPWLGAGHCILTGLSLGDSFNPSWYDAHLPNLPVWRQHWSEDSHLSQGGQQAEQVPQVSRPQRESSDNFERSQLSESFVGILSSAKQAL